MSEKLPQPPQSEEVDLGQLFNAIGKLFERLFKFIGSVFKGVFSAFIYILKPFVENFKLVIIAVAITAVLGYIYEKTKKPVYFSEMMVKPYFESKYQLSNNIDYFNTLIGSSNYEELSNIFEIDNLTAKALVGFDLQAGLETQNDLFIEYDEYIRSIDTSLVNELSYTNYLENRGLLSGNIFTIKAKALKIDVFQKLQEGFRKTFENEFSKHKKMLRDTLAYLDREALNKQLDRLDSIQKTYLEAIKNESKSKNLSLGIGNGFPLQEEKTVTKEYELYLKEQEIRRTINFLDKKIAEDDTYYDVLYTFDKIGKKENSLKQRYSIVFPLLILTLFILVFLAIKAFHFIKNYE